MTTTFQTLQQNVQRDIIDLPLVVQQAVPNLVNAAHKTIQRVHNFVCMRASVSATTAANTRVLVAIPSDWKEARVRPGYDPQYGTRRPLVWAKDEEVEQRYVVTDTGCPQYLVDDGTNINVWPLSDGYSDWTDGQYHIVIPYWAYLQDLVATGDHDWITDNAAEYIEYQAAADGFAMNWDEAHSTYWQARADKKRLEIINADKGRQLAGLDILVPHKGAYGPRLGR